MVVLYTTVGIYIFSFNFRNPKLNISIRK